jgi:tetratricopeptide (TPR) repeat protein
MPLVINLGGMWPPITNKAANSRVQRPTRISLGSRFAVNTKRLPPVLETIIIAPPFLWLYWYVQRPWIPRRAMAEALAALGVAAAIAQFVQIGAAVVKRIHEFASSAQDVPDSLKSTADQLPVMIDICQRILSDGVDEEDTTLLNLVMGCIKCVQEQENLITSLLPKPEDKFIVKSKKAVRSIVTDKKMEKIQRNLESYKSTLIFHRTHATSKASSFISKQVTCYCYPSRGISQFVEREAVLHNLEQALSSADKNRPRCAVLIGMGGQGKTSLAIEYCRRSAQNKRYRTILWVDASSPLALERSFSTCADRISSETRKLDDLASTVQFVKDALEGHGWLMVFDNYDQPEDFDDFSNFYPDHGNGAVLITSRHADATALGTELQLEGMGEDEGIELLLRRTKFNKGERDVRLAAKQILQRLGNLPLAIDQAGAYMTARNLSPPAFLQQYDKRIEHYFGQTPKVWDYKRRASEETKAFPLSVRTTWEMSLEQIPDGEGRRESVEHLLALSAFLGGADISSLVYEVFYDYADEPPSWMSVFATPGSWDAYDYEDVITELSRLSLLQQMTTDNDECIFSLHPLIRDWVQLRIPQQKRTEYVVESAIVLASYVNKHIPTNSLSTSRRILSYQDALVQSMSRFSNPNVQLGTGVLRDAGRCFALFYNLHGRYNDAEVLLNMVRANDEQQHGLTHPFLLDTTRHLASVLKNQGQHVKAQQLLEPVLKKAEAVYDSAPEVLELRMELAAVYAKQGKLQESKIVHENLLEYYTNHTGSHSVQFLRCLEQLGQLYRWQGKHDAAIGYFTRVLEYYEKNVGHDKLHTFRVIVHLANARRALSQYAEAEKLLLQALKGLENSVGVYHPDTAGVHVDIAISFRSIGQFEKAESHFALAIDGFNKSLGPGHPDTLRAMMNSAILLDRPGRIAEATVLYKQVLSGRLKKLGSGHAYTMRTVERLAYVLWLQGEREEAEDLATRILTSNGKINTQESVSPSSRGSNAPEYNALILLYEQALARDTAKLNPGHVDVVEAQTSLAAVRQAQKETEDSFGDASRVTTLRESRSSSLADDTTLCSPSISTPCLDSVKVGDVNIQVTTVDLTTLSI